ncbi:MAG: class I SAM-dependent DNA methyltransferase [Polyangiaceae bacterium]|nr:class I SAM-dependent DNA methyltransferase [Polyangiaceae bacterium]
MASPRTQANVTAKNLRPSTASGPKADSAPPASPRSFGGFSEITSFIWGVADLLRGDYKQADYGKVILPLTVIRRLDCVLDKCKAKVLAKHAELKQAKHPEGTIEKMLLRASGTTFYNTSKLDFEKLKGDPNNIAANLTSYIKGFSPTARDVIEQFKFTDQIAKLEDANLLFQVVSRFADVDLHPEKVPNHVMGSIFEELIRKFAEASNETAGEHFTPREVIRLMVDLLFIEDEDTLAKKGIVRTLYDPAAGTGGMLSVAEEYLRELNPDAELKVYGQELNSESYAICKSDMMIKGQDPEHIIRGNSFSEDGHSGKKFDYMLSNPPFGVEWKKVQKEIENEHETQGFAGRFGPGLPRINDGSLLFLLHMLSKMKPVDAKGEGGSRLAIVFNGSPLFTGDAGSGESEIRKWVIENDWLEAIVALPDQLFYNTPISTYLWIVTNRKPKARRGKVQLINGVELFQKMRKSLGNKRNELGKAHIETLAKTYGDFLTSDIAKVFDNADFGFRRITVERPLRLNFQASPERLERLQEESGFAALAKSKKKGAPGEREAEEGRELQEKIVAVLRTLNPSQAIKNRDAFEKTLRSAFQKAKLDVPTPVFKSVMAALSERDESADVCTDSKGRPEPDAELRDNENVPLKEDIQKYFKREVLPHVPDAWIDESKTKIGYEIPFTRHFYKYKALRPLSEIEAEIRALEGEIQGMLGEVLG